MSVTNVTCNIGDKEIKFETGKLALQAPGSVVVTSGETVSYTHLTLPTMS